MLIIIMQIYHVNCQTSDGFTLHGLRYSNRPAKKVAIFIHGTGDSNILKKSDMLTAIADKIPADLVAFNNRGSSYVSKLKKVVGTKTIEKMAGMAYEEIKDCIPDIEGMIAWALNHKYTKITLIGHSTGANKIAVFLDSESNFKKYVERAIFLAGGDDIGLQTSRLPDAEKLSGYLEKQIATGHGNELVSTDLFPGKHPISVVSLYELISEGSDYDIFPFAKNFTTLHDGAFKKLRSIRIPGLCIYGTDDPGTIIPATKAVSILKRVNKNLEATLIPKADHGFTGFEDQLAQHIANFLDK